MEWLADTIGQGPAMALFWLFAALLVLLLLLFILRLFRASLPGTFIRGGNRKNRLAVIDAAPVDSNRRLILVRRDDTEHLLLIGGSADIVIENGILASTGDMPGESRQAEREQRDDNHAKAAMTAAAAVPVAVAVSRSETVSDIETDTSAQATSIQDASYETDPEDISTDFDDMDLDDLNPAKNPPAQPEAVSPGAFDKTVPADTPSSASAAHSRLRHEQASAREPETGSMDVEENSLSLADPSDSLTEEMARDLEKTLAPLRSEALVQPAERASEPQQPVYAQQQPHDVEVTQPARPEPVIDIDGTKAPEKEISLEDEMSALLAELSRDGKN